MIDTNIHHRVPRCLLKAHDAGNGPITADDFGDVQAYLDWDEEALRYQVNPDISREDLEALIENSTVEIPAEEHTNGHTQAGDFARWGKLGGTKTLTLYGRQWFSLLGKRRWGRVEPKALASYQEGVIA